MGELTAIITLLLIVFAIILCVLAILLPLFVYRIYKDIKLVRKVIVEATSKMGYKAI